MYFFFIYACLFCSTVAASVPAEALKLFPIDWSGTGSIRTADYQQAIQALKQDAPGTDTAFYFLKLGLVHTRLNNRLTALPYLKLAAQQSELLAPLAFMVMGDLEFSSQQMTNAAEAYLSALYKECPGNYKTYIFQKIKLLYDHDSSLSSKDIRYNEFMDWIKTTYPPPKPDIIPPIDSLINAKAWKALDTIFDTAKLQSNAFCSMIEKLTDKIPFDSLRMSSLLTFAQQASTCGEYETAEQLLEMVERKASKPLAAKALNFNARMAMSRNQIDKALKLFKRYNFSYGPDSDVIMNIARCYRKKDNSFEASKWYDKYIAHFPKSNKAQEILWLQAWQKESRKRYASAGALYKKIYTMFKSGSRRDEAYIRHALCYYRTEKFDSTITVLSTFIKKYPSSSLYPAAVFWKGKAYLAKENDSLKAVCFRQVADYDPFDYYAFRARYYLSASGTAISPPLDSSADMMTALKWADSISADQLTKFSRSDSVNFQRAMICASLGFQDLAGLFFDSIIINSQDLATQFKIALFYSACGNTAQAFKIIRRLAWRIPLQCRGSAPVGVYLLLYPAFYSNIILDRATIEAIDPNLVSAVMRQESIFNPKIVSPAGAIGLMQIMPYTGEQLAGDLKIPFLVDSLYNPAYNIKLGTYYLKQLSESCNNNFVMVLSSYNAGPHNAKKWYQKNKQEEFDLFVEDIEFTETRNYVKKVMGNYWSYQELCRYSGYKQNYFSGAKLY
ncbi:MAG TPA: transglycosylase SLT domain-containing protein [Chitinispirillaceae bacterium]|nr:transglycosylase SLT domain-containing protein [Chitinispirillaceae bacterium]